MLFRLVLDEAVHPRTGDDVPRPAVDLVAQGDPFLTLVPLEDDLVPVEGPRAELHLALLLIEGEVLDVDGAGALVNGWRNPENVSVLVDDDVWLIRHFVLPIGAAGKEIS